MVRKDSETESNNRKSTDKERPKNGREVKQIGKTTSKSATANANAKRQSSDSGGSEKKTGKNVTKKKQRKKAQPKTPSMQNPQKLPFAGFPNIHVGQNGKPSLASTIDNLEYLLKGYGISVNYNVITKRTDIHIPGLSGSPDNADASALTHVISLAALNGLPTGQVGMYLEVIGDRNQVNPVLDYIKKKEWDGVDRTGDLCDTLETAPDFPVRLKKCLILKWAISAVAAISSDRFRTKGVLSLQGLQSIGKTSWILSLIDDPYLRDQIIKIDLHLDPGNKDSVLTATSHWIAEIGELDSSFKKDIARLKGFISSDQDKIRRPYGRRDSVYPRRTVFIATVNHGNFLVDDTGNTRWWTIPVISINFEHNIDMQQFWAQIFSLYEQGEQWWLTLEEERELEAQNAKHRSVNSIRDLVFASLDLDIDEADRQSMSASELLRELKIVNPTNAQSRDCGGALRELLGEPKISQGIGKWMVPLKGDDFLANLY